MKRREEFLALDLETEFKLLGPAGTKKHPNPARQAFAQRFGFDGEHDPLLAEEMRYRRDVRAYERALVTIPQKADAQVAALASLVIPTNQRPPKKRAGCAAIARPCMRMRCKYNLVPEWFAHVKDMEYKPLDSACSCALDVADDDKTLEHVGGSLNITRERIRQIQKKAIDKVGRYSKSYSHVEDWKTP